MAKNTRPKIPFAAYSGQGPFIFVSYAHDDAASVYSELRWIKAQGFNVWYDEGISPGHSWQDELANRIDSCALFLCYISQNAVKSRNCLRETAYAVSKNKEFLAIHLEETELPSGLALEIGDRQAILKDQFPRDIYQSKVIHALSSYVSAPSTYTVAERNEPVVESVETAVSANVAMPWSPFKKAAAVFFAIAVIALIASQWLLPGSKPESELAEFEAETDNPDQVQQLVEQLVEQQDYVGAYLQATQLQSQSPNYPALAQLWPLFSDQGSVLSEPSGADVWLKDYKTPAADWTYMGKTPLNDIRLPSAYFRLKLEKEGHNPLEVVAVSPHFTFGSLLEAPNIGPFPIRLPPVGTPQDMVYIPAGGGGARLGISGFAQNPTNLGPFLIDIHEVSNRQFKEFVDQQGYEKEEYWQGLGFEEDDRTSLSLAQARQQFVDSTGRQGPANWELGYYLAGQDNYPVTGISWYEAIAYARFRGKELPTAYHWARAAYTGLYFNAAIGLSNFSGTVAEVGTSQAVGPFGTLDMSGNAREWVWNKAGDNRWTLGGAWSDSNYMSFVPYSLPPLNRDDSTGFRLVQYLDEGSIDDDLLQPIDSTARDYTSETPVSDEVYAVLLEQFPYSRGNLEPVVQIVDDSNPDWTKEKIVINTGYDNQRFALYLFSPKTPAPHQAVIFFPGITPFISLQSSEAIQPDWLDFIIRSGRTLVIPIYYGSYERYSGIIELSGDANINMQRQRTVRWGADMRRTLDYLETRDDIIDDSFAFLGFSFGANQSTPLLAIEERLKAAVLVSGGFPYYQLPTVADPLNYVSRITMPVLMLNGRYDSMMQLESQQIPFFNQLGTAREDKRRVLYDMGHTIPPRIGLVTETVAWLDKYLGAIE